ncbi:hypothetical protein [Herbaspirillum huttiense]|uniref:hypothetical protein n=1 Tax=Herbaspirillum huttiense TaxID=863372 RepID=UPI0039AF81EB
MMDTHRFWIAATFLLAAISALAADTNLVGARVVFTLSTVLFSSVLVYRVCVWVEVLRFGTKADLTGWADEKGSSQG